MPRDVDRRPSEGVVLDFKVEDACEWVDAVAAFANTAGGIVLLGVKGNKKQNNAPIAVPGMELTAGDIKAR